jgi:hypothetical protein
VPQATFRETAQRLQDWFTLQPALGAARTRLPRPDGPARAALDQARMLREVVRQIASPVDELPPGRFPAVLLSLCRDLVYWTLAARRTGAGDAALDLAALWDRSPADDLLRAAGTPENLDAVRRTLVDLPMPSTLDATDADVARVRAFAEALFRQLEAPRHRVRRLLVRRWLHRAAAVTAVLTIALAIRAAFIGPDLAKGKQFRASSNQVECWGDPECSTLMFHTTLQDNPWVEIDLGAIKKIHLIEARNRPACCQERAVPLIAEVSTDGVHWTQVARRDSVFLTWTATFPRVAARYVKLRVPRNSILHLEGVSVR